MLGWDPIVKEELKSSKVPSFKECAMTEIIAKSSAKIEGHVHQLQRKHDTIFLLNH